MATVAITPKSVEDSSPDFGILNAEDMPCDSSPQAQFQQAVVAARYAQEAASQSATLANHVAQLSHLVHNLWTQLSLQTQKVQELEEWKNKTLLDMRKLRDEHKQLRKKYGVGEDDDKQKLITRSYSNPVPTAEDEDKPKFLNQAKSAPASVDTSGPGVPPGLDLPLGLERNISEMTSATDMTDMEDIEVSPAEGGGGALGIKLVDKVVDGKAVKKAEWKIGRLSAQLRNCCGRALVSPPFSVWGLEDLRLMIYADKREMHKGPRSRRQKELYNKKVSDGPLESCLKLKVPNCTTKEELSFLFTVGEDEMRSAEYRHNFLDATVSEPVDFGELDWLEKADKEGGLTVSVEIKEVSTA